jgi:single-stranded DNA-binding protein
MLSYYNNIKLIGRINTPVIKQLENGEKRAEFLIRTEIEFTSFEGNKNIEDTWHQCLAWGSNADLIERYAYTSSIVGVEGILVSLTSIGNSKSTQNAFVEVKEFLLLE